METLSASTPLPIACNLSADELQARHGEVEALFAAASGVRELLDGYDFAFPADAQAAHALLDFIVEERACCPFFTFTLTFAAPHDAIWLALRGGEGVKDFVRGSFLTVTSVRPE
ncbi:MAG TPA: hypothetical protein VGP82_16700 [Ktedonobacterales bacterium]|nr:hypothetical protein [Ktedonobacterales bacterium]